MFFHQRFIPGLAIASYIVGDDKTKHAAVIDPTRDVDEIIRIAKTENLKITHIFETHVHADFVSGAVELKSRLNGEPKIVCSAMGGAEWTPAYADVKAMDGQEFSLGSIRLRAMHTPGHTPEHVSWVLFDDGRSKDTPWLMFSGDFLFVGDVGRPDLLGEVQRQKLASQLYQSVFGKLAPIPEFTEVYPGHGAGSLCGKAIGSRRSSTVGFERRFNASLSPANESEWIKSLLNGMPPAPPYFKRMKEVNRTGPALLGTILPGQNPLSNREAKRLIENGAIVLDVRPAEAFAAGHIPGSINVPLCTTCVNWTGWVLPYDREIILVTTSASELTEAITQLIRIGLDRIAGWIEGGIESWKREGLEVASLQTISAQDLANQLRDAKPFVLDIRTPGEWGSGHIDIARHIPVGDITAKLSEIPRDQPVAVICGSGYRGTIVGSMLQREGYRNVSNVRGGMTAWQAAGLPSIR